MKNYEPKYNWKHYNAEALNIEDGSTFGGKAFIELLYDNHLIRGSAVELSDAEDIALKKLLKIQNCCHEFKRFNDKGRAKCQLCGFSKDDVFENLERCHECKCHNPTIYVDSDKYCITHAISALENKNNISKLDSHEKGLLTYLYAVDDLELIKDANKCGDLESLEFLSSTLYRNSYSFFMDMAEELANDVVTLDDNIKTLLLWQKYMDEYYEQLMNSKDAIKKFIIAIDEKTNLTKDDFKSFVS